MSRRKPSFIASLKARLRRAVLNYLEAGQRWQSGRAYIPGNVTDARFDVSSAERLEVVRKIRNYQYNDALLNQLCDLFELYTVGPNGLQLTPASVDDKWNEKAEVAWQEWCKFSDLTSRQSFGVIQGLLARLWFFDGEVFILKTFGAPQVGPGGKVIAPPRPRIQLIETHRVATPNGGVEGKTIIDGVEVDGNGRPVAYWVREGNGGPLDEAKFVRKDADTIIHLFEPSRAGQYRGLPLPYAVINDLADLDELQKFEMQAAKQNAQVTRVVKNELGEEDDGTLKRDFPTKVATGDLTDTQRSKYYAEVFGSEVHVIKNGDSYEQFASQRPSVAVQTYWDYLIEKICAGVGIPKALVYPSSMQGTVQRGIYDTANSFFRARSAVIEDAVLEVYRFVMNYEVNYNPNLKGDKPYGWDTATTCPPRAVNVDTGRNATAIIQLHAEGFGTYESYYASLGQNWKRELAQNAREVAYLKLQAQLASQLYPNIEVTPGNVCERMVEVAAPVQPQGQLTA